MLVSVIVFMSFPATHFTASAFIRQGATACRKEGFYTTVTVNKHI